jgi:hypothetical protein
VARVWLGAARFVFVQRNEGRRMLWFDGLDRLIGRSVGALS